MERQSDDMGAVKGTGNTALHSSDAWHSGAYSDWVKGHRGGLWVNFVILTAPPPPPLPLCQPCLDGVWLPRQQEREKKQKNVNMVFMPQLENPRRLRL